MSILVQIKRSQPNLRGTCSQFWTAVAATTQLAKDSNTSLSGRSLNALSVNPSEPSREANKEGKAGESYLL